MWALIEDNTITKIINNPKAMVIGDTQYSRNIFSFRWSNAEREAIGLYEIVFDNYFLFWYFDFADEEPLLEEYLQQQCTWNRPQLVLHLSMGSLQEPMGLGKQNLGYRSLPDSRVDMVP